MRIVATGLTLFVLRLIGAAPHAAPVPTITPGTWEVLCRHFDQDTHCSETLTSLKAKNIRTLIATVPDPDRTDLRLHFDRSLDSLLWAVADSGYSLERRWLPWSPTPGDSDSLLLSLKPDPSPGAEQKLTLARADPGRKPKDEPGILLFRGETWDCVLVVFLVGETVTGGLELPMFRKALGYIHDLGDGNDVWIVGPTFSGTFVSLAQGIRDAEPKSSFHVISGTATHHKSKVRFENESFGGSTVHLGATLENDRFAANAFFRYLRSRWIWPGEIALLAEDQTAYGGVAEKTPGDDSSEQWLFMRFPYGISRLRNSYEQQNAAATVTNDKSQAPTPAAPPTLQFNIGTPDEKDIVPAFSKVQSPLSQEASLLGIVSSLQRERVSYVGIMATDVLDAVFLARFLRKTCPDVRIFLFDSDLLFARAEPNAAFEGILNITTYPLFGRNQHWTRTELKGVLPRRTAFANRYAEGEYNAARKQLWEMQAISHSMGEVLLDYRRPDRLYPQERRPPLWLTVLGRDGYWPVALLDKVAKQPEDADSSLESAPPQGNELPSEELHPEPPSHAWTLILAAVTVFAVVHCLYTWLVYLYPGASPTVSMALYRFLAAYPRDTAESVRAPIDADVRNSEAYRCPRLLLLVTTVLLCAEMVLAATGVPYVFRRGDKAFFDYWYFYVPVAAAVGLLATAGFITFRPGANRAVGWGAWVGALIFACAWWFPFLCYYKPERQAFFFAYRMAHPGNGVSPATPVLLFLGALFAWGFMLLSRRAGVPPPQVPQIGDIAELAATLNRGLAMVVSGRSLIPALAMVLLWGVFFRGLFRLRSVEALSYDLLILFLLAVSYGLLFAAWSQLLEAWKRFRQFLEALERHPMHKAFSRLPKELSALPLFQPEPQKVDLFTSARSSHTADALVAELESTPYAVSLGVHADAIRRFLRIAELQHAMLIQECPDFYGPVSAVSHQLEQTVLRTANDLVSWSQDKFWKDGDSSSLPEKEDSADRLQRERILAEEFIALRLVLYIRHVLRQMRSLLWFVVIDFVLIVLALSSYPFLSASLVTVLCIGSLLILGTGIALVFAQMDRDAVLSALSSTTPNEIGKPFYVRLASFGALPLLAVLATRFPSISQFLSGWVQPAIEALR